jgi:WhiB family redox-sensing transcriptional regulator
MRRAACSGRDDIDWFDIDCGLSEAVRICHSCPVMTDCLNYAIRNDLEDGVWGGLWGYRLKQMRTRKVTIRARGRGVTPPQGHRGTGGRASDEQD